MFVVELGNDLKQLRAREQQEIARILQALSDQIAPHAEGIFANIELLTHLDFAFAKGLLAREMRASLPKMNTRGYLKIVRGRHPLIDPDKVVPSDLWLGDQFTTLIITGPNTGGKTVTLKTVGLFTLMAQSGLHVPAELGTELSVFGRVYADIGDEQSIEQSLSTFSSHMTNIVEIVSCVQDNDLVLFDELGAGTDPTEGAALAQSILSSLLERKVRTMATTHYSELKAFALSTPGVENASVEFDVESLRPTYRLSIGIPGKSNAFDISRKLGLPERLIDGAKALLSKEDIRFEDVIANAEYHRQIAEREREIAEETRRETVKLRDEAERLRREIEQSRDKSLKKAKDEARRVMEKRPARGRRHHPRAQGHEKAGPDPGARGPAPQKAHGGRHRRPQRGPERKERRQLHPAQERASRRQRGDRASGHEGHGALPRRPQRRSADSGRHHQDEGAHQPATAGRGGQAQAEPRDEPNTRSSVAVPMEVDVRGMTLDEAIAAVDIYLADATLAGLNEVSIIHGKGTGVLRTGIQRHLRTHMNVKKYRDGMYGEGEQGVTVVTLK